MNLWKIDFKYGKEYYSTKMSMNPDVGEPNWSQFVAVEKELGDEVVTVGEETGNWPKQVPEWFANSYRNSLPEEKAFGRIFGNLFRPTLREVLARTPEEVKSLFDGKAQHILKLEEYAEQLRASRRSHFLKGPDGLPPGY